MEIIFEHFVFLQDFQVTSINFLARVIYIFQHPHQIPAKLFGTKAIMRTKEKRHSSHGKWLIIKENQ